MKNLSKEEVRTGMMTLQECKDQVAEKHYYSEWSKLCPNGNLEGVPDKWIDEVAELYASQFKSQSEAQTEKPDFEQLAVDYTRAFEQGCEIIWDKYVSPLQARVKELEFSYKSIEGVYIAAEKHNEILKEKVESLESENAREQKEDLDEMFNRWIDDDGNPPDIDKVVKTLRPDIKMELKALEGEEIFTRQDVKNLMEIARAPLVKNLDYCHKRMAEAYTEIERLKSQVSVGEEKKN